MVHTAAVILIPCAIRPIVGIIVYCETMGYCTLNCVDLFIVMGYCSGSL